VGSEIHYPKPPHRQKALQRILDHQEFPLSDEIHRTTLSLPISFFHTEADIRQVIDIMNAFSG
jgi:dTDP-4-amino-4,6-dideoxygalactose transaminase